MREARLLLFLPVFAFAYNLDVQHPLIYRGKSDHGATQGPDHSYFGYTVILHAKSHVSISGSTVYESWIIVGAPRANYSRHPDQGNEIPVEPGVVYRCPLKETCVPINVTNPDDEVGAIEEMNLHTLIEKGHGWFGAAMSSDPTGVLTVCAPRTIVRIYYSLAINYQNTMHGVCYHGHLESGDLQIEDKNFSNFDFTSAYWYNPLNGFSVHYPSRQAKLPSETVQPVIGSPKHEIYGSVREMGQQKFTTLALSDELTQFGYALTSGYYFKEDQLMVVSSAPGWQYVGLVAIMDPRSQPMATIIRIKGDEVGEFFGGSLATGDLNKDGLDDLVVGSPHWSNDNGKVQIFFGNKDATYEAAMTLEGDVVDGLYGYALICGDLDGDGYDELIVGAPWEESGVIYVYNGEANLHEITMIPPSQRIVGIDIRPDIQRFGFSFAKPVDMDGNGFADLGVGAYGAGHAMVLSSRPVLKTEITLTTFPTALSRNAKSFILEVCVRNFIKNKPSMWAFECTATVDEDYKRVVYKSSNTMILTWKRPPDGKACDNTTFTLSTTSRNFIDVIDIVVTHRILNSSYESQGHRSSCELCPIEYKGSHVTVARTTLPFDIGCGMDGICHSFIFARLFFPNVNNSTWIIGSDDLELVLLVGNHAEPAYLTTVTFHIPKAITLRSILPSCQEDNDGETLTVTCDVGNPLGTAIEKKVSLDLDMNRLHNGLADGTNLDFRVDIKTRSVNRGRPSFTTPLYLKANLSVALSGKAYDESYYFNYNKEKPSNVSFQHTYQISRFGATPIVDARISVRVPYKIGDSEYLTLANKPQVSLLGRFYECTVSNVTIATSRAPEKISNRRKFQDMIRLDTFANNTRSRRTAFERGTSDELRGSDVTSRVTLRPTESTSNATIPRTDYYRSMPEFANVKEIYLNCSTPNVTCGEIVCNVGHLKSSHDVAKIQIKLVIDHSKFPDEADGIEKVIHCATEASLEVVSPKMRYVVSGTGVVVPVTTKFHFARSVKTVSTWIIIVSIFLGLLALVVLALILKKIQFFKRKTKEELDMLKNNDAIPLESELMSENE